MENIPGWHEWQSSWLKVEKMLKTWGTSLQVCPRHTMTWGYAQKTRTSNERCVLRDGGGVWKVKVKVVEVTKKQRNISEELQWKNYFGDTVHDMVRIFRVNIINERFALPFDVGLHTVTRRNTAHSHHQIRSTGRNTTSKWSLLKWCIIKSTRFLIKSLKFLIKSHWISHEVVFSRK